MCNILYLSVAVCIADDKTALIGRFACILAGAHTQQEFPCILHSVLPAVCIHVVAPRCTASRSASKLKLLASGQPPAGTQRPSPWPHRPTSCGRTGPLLGLQGQPPAGAQARSLASKANLLRAHRPTAGPAAELPPAGTARGCRGAEGCCPRRRQAQGQGRPTGSKLVG